jgi:hypothetical protein
VPVLHLQQHELGRNLHLRTEPRVSPTPVVNHSSLRSGHPSTTGTLLVLTPAHMQAPPRTNATPPGRMHANHLKTGQLQQLQLILVRPVTTSSQTGAQHVHRTSTLTGQTGDLDRSDRCTTEPGNGSKPPENLPNASSKPFQAQASPPC